MCLYNQALADTRSTGAGIGCLYCSMLLLLGGVITFIPSVQIVKGKILCGYHEYYAEDKDGKAMIWQRGEEEEDEEENKKNHFCCTHHYSGHSSILMLLVAKFASTK